MTVTQPAWGRGLGEGLATLPGFPGGGPPVYTSSPSSHRCGTCVDCLRAKHKNLWASLGNQQSHFRFLSGFLFHKRFKSGEVSPLISSCSSYTFLHSIISSTSFPSFLPLPPILLSFLLPSSSHSFPFPFHKQVNYSWTCYVLICE